MASFSQHSTPTSRIEEKTYPSKNAFSEFLSASHELAFWHEKKRSVHNHLNNMLHQQSKENWGVFPRRLNSLPTSLEMIIYNLQSELELINKHIAELQQLDLTRYSGQLNKRDCLKESAHGSRPQTIQSGVQAGSSSFSH